MVRLKLIDSAHALFVDRLLNRGVSADDIHRMAAASLEVPLPVGYVAARIVERQEQAAIKATLPDGITQRTPEWYAARENYVTASDFYYAAFGTDAAKRRFVASTSGNGAAFTGSAATRWGVKYEDWARLLYELYMSTTVREYGLLLHETVDIMAASPDGISEQAVCVEIKSTVTRTLADIPPEYYAQMQGQMEVTGLHLADFVVCKAEEYEPEEFWPKFEDAHASGYGYERFGAIGSKDKPDGTLSFVYSTPGMSPDELRAWVSETLDTHTQCSFHGTPNFSVRRIARDDEYVASMIAELRKTWEMVLQARTEPPRERVEKESYAGSPLLKGFAFKNFS